MTEQTHVKYHNQQLFPYTGEIRVKSIDRLRRQAEIHEGLGLSGRRRMQARGLFAAALTLKVSVIWTAQLLERGSFVMGAQKDFFRSRWKKHPSQWGDTAKCCLARAWSGYSLGKDAVCIDRHLERLDRAYGGAVEQWAHWFDLYESMYGAGETELCILWHIRLLDWIAFGGDRPRAWK